MHIKIFEIESKRTRTECEQGKVRMAVKVRGRGGILENEDGRGGTVAGKGVL
jgi:hypothetical protein